MLDTKELPYYQKMANTLRFLCADMVERANSGHPGAPMGLSEIAVVLSYHLTHSPKNPTWINRDRLVFSGGHASALLYSLLHLWGYEVSLEDLKNFRQLGSKTPGHPEYHHTPGVEITTGPLGQGIANAVGFAMAAKLAQNLLNTQDAPLITHKVFCLCGDGDLEEGISYEACSQAGFYGLNNLILIYDSNHITIEGDTKINFNEDIKERFIAQKWEVLEVCGHDILQIDKTLTLAKQSSKPCLIIAHTQIAKGAVGLEGSSKAHGAPLGEKVLEESKKKANFPNESFYIDEDVLLRFRNAIELGTLAETKWREILQNSPKKELLHSLMNPNFKDIQYPEFQANGAIATRVSNGLILNSIAQSIQGFIGGSADLAPSNNTELKQMGDFPNGRNFHFGVREHSMAAIANALSVYGLFIPFVATFFVFSDYLIPSARLAALMKLRIFYIFTHDSIAVGEDGATHQPIEQLSHFRALPNFYSFRPADAFENVACWQVALELNAPCSFVLSRQNLPLLEHVSKESVSRGVYVKKATQTTPKVTLIASGSEVSLALESANLLEQQNISTQVLSAPCFDLFDKQDSAYKQEVLQGFVVAIEASRALEWFKYCDEVIGINEFGRSGKGKEVAESFGFSAENIKQHISSKLT